MKRVLYARLASLIEARQSCLERAGNENLPMEDRKRWAEMAIAHQDSALELTREYMPSGSGFDVGTTLDLENSQPNKLVFDTEFHHMDEHGGYDGWSFHSVTVRPSLAHGIVVTVSGQNRNYIKDYIAETFDEAVSAEIDIPTPAELEAQATRVAGIHTDLGYKPALERLPADGEGLEVGEVVAWRGGTA